MSLNYRYIHEPRLYSQKNVLGDPLCTARWSLPHEVESRKLWLLGEFRGVKWRRWAPLPLSAGAVLEYLQ